MKSIRVDDAVPVPRPVQTIASQASIAEAMAVMRKLAIHHLIVVDKGVVVGVMAERDVWERGLDDQLRVKRDSPVADIMTALTAGIDADAHLADAVVAMQHARTTGLPIMRRGVLVGILTETDLMQLFGVALAAGRNEGDALEDVRARGNVLMSNPVVQSALELLGQAGI